MSYVQSLWPILNQLRARARAASIFGPTRTLLLERAFPLLTAIRGRMVTRVTGPLQPTLAEVEIGPDWIVERPTANSRDITAGTLTESQRQMAEEFRRGMAKAIGVPPEAIRNDVVQEWIVNWIQAFAKPEQWVEVAPTIEEMRELGRQSGEICKSAYFRR